VGAIQRDYVSLVNGDRNGPLNCVDGHDQSSLVFHSDNRAYHTRK
jgi:hypothetical protein